MMRHKWADVLIAIADGKEVEFFNNGSWYDYNPALHSDPITDNAIGFQREWRVKKEPVITVKYFYKSVSLHNFESYEEFMPDLEKWDLKLTYQDGIAIKAELPTRK